MGSIKNQGMDDKEVKLNDKPKYQILEVEDTKYKTLLPPKFEKRKPWNKPDYKKIYSFLPGTVLKLSVKVGEKIKPGQLLMQFEAMKMVNSVKADRAGTIKNIHIKPGDKLPKNFLMFEFE